MPARLKRNFFRRDPVSLARALLGQRLVHAHPSGEKLTGMIVEVEAYLGVPDKAAHTYKGRRTPRNEAMYLDAGHAYVYFTYGMHHCMNVTSDSAGVPTACLLRAIEPLEGLALMTAHRSVKVNASRLKPRDLCSGPAKLTQAFAIDRRLNGVDLVKSDSIWIERGRGVSDDEIEAGTRVGVGYSQEWADKPLRFWLRGHPHVSRG